MLIGTKRNLVRLMTVISLMLVVGCSSEDDDLAGVSAVPDASDASGTKADSPITFAGGIGRTNAVTRAATGLHDESVNDFRVWGYKNTAMTGDAYTAYQTVMDGYRLWWDDATVTGTNTNNWEYVNGTTQTVKYWDMSAKAYRFFAIAPATAYTSATIAGDDTKSLSVALTVDATDEAKIPYYSLLWYSTGNLTDFPDKQFRSTVAMQFLRPVAYVRFMFTFERELDAATTTLTAKSFRPSDGGLIEQKGNVIITCPITGTATTETWSIGSTGLDGITTFTQDFYINSLDPSDENACKTYTVLPARDQGTYTLQVSVNGDPKSVVVPEEYMNWSPNYEYTYMFKIHLDGSVTIDNVESAFTPWTEHNGDHTVYNW